MSVANFYEMRVSFPDLLIEIVKFFDLYNTDINKGGLEPKSISEFFSYYQNIKSQNVPQPYLIVQACQKLAQNGKITEIQKGGFQGVDNKYACSITDTSLFTNKIFLRILDCIVYEMQAVYDIYGKSVLPIVNESSDENLQIGSAFVMADNVLITAAHCISPAAGLSLRGVSKEALASAKYYIHPEEALDLAVVVFNDSVFAGMPPTPIATSQPPILEEVMALGYPNVPGYHPTLAAEAATVSGRFTAVRGRIASQPSEIFSKAELLLITARVRGGFSGGPVMNKFGEAVGVVSREPGSQDDSGVGQRYDNLGYGTAIPSKHIRELLHFIDDKHIEPIDVTSVNFGEFE